MKDSFNKEFSSDKYDDSISTLLSLLKNIDKRICKLENEIKNIKKEKKNYFETQFKYIDKSFYRLNSVIARNLSIADLHHSTFAKFKACHTNQSIVVVGSGPSLNYFDSYSFQEKPIYIALNSSFLYEQVKFDYLFIQDYSGLKKIMPLANKYRKEKCTKFYGILPESAANMATTCLIPESDAIEAKALRYRTDYVSSILHNPTFTYDLLNCPLGDFYTVSLVALQFALWTMPRKIYLVGLDCTNEGHFNNDTPNQLKTNNIIESFKKFKDFVEAYYPTTEVISINPIGLKGIFKDEYTDTFIKSYS